MKNRTTMIVALALFALVVASVPAGAAKPDRPPKLAVSLDAEPVWVFEGADIISYTVTLENKTSKDITGVAVKLTTDPDAYPDAVDVWDLPEDAVPGVVPANSRVGLDFYLYVDQFAEAIPCLAIDPDSWPDECALLATAAVLIDENLLTQVTMSTPLMPIPSCEFDYYVDVDDNFVSYPVQVSDICIWTLPPDGEVTKTGVWGITLYPTLPDKPKRNLTAEVSVRDHVPGNWCPLAVDASWGFGERWPFDVPIIGEVYLPGDEDFSEQDLGNGVCLAGGAGGDYFAVGNPDSFYLRTNGDVTVQWLGPDPSDWDWPDPNG